MGRFLLVSGDFVETGGMDRANHALASHLADRGDEVHLATHRASADLAGRPNVTVHRVAKPLNSYMLSGPLLDRAGRRLARRLAGAGARVVVNGGNCRWGDVNWLHYVHAAWTPGAAGGPARRLKAALARRLDLVAERAALPMARLLLANSERTRADAIERLGVPADRVRTVYLGVDADRFRPATPDGRAAARARLGWDDDRPTLAFVGALGDLRKGFDTLFAAWHRLAAEPSWDARLAVVGAGGMLPIWKERAASAGLGRSIEFLGFRSDVPEILRACDALASPARYEPYGLNVQEALCAGLPALVSASAGVAERYPESLRDLLIPDPDDADDLADRLRSWRDRMAEYRAAVAPLGERLRAQTWGRMAGQIVGLIEGDGRADGPGGGA